MRRCRGLEGVLVIRWKQPGPYHIESECGKYRVAKFSTSGTPTYTAFVKGKGWDPVKVDDRIQVFPSFKAASEALSRA